VVKEFCQRAASYVVLLLRIESSLLLRVPQHINAFQWDRQRPKVAHSRGRSRSRDLHLINGSLGLPESAMQTASPSVQLFLQHTDHATCDICSNRPHLMHYMHAMRSNNGPYEWIEMRIKRIISITVFELTQAV